MGIELGLGLGLRFGGKVSAAAPANTVAPSISGIQTAGQTLAVSNGAWSQPVSSYAFQWKRNGTDIAGALAQTYLLQAADVGRAISCTVTATNSAGSGSATSAAVGPIAAPVTVGGALSTDAFANATWSFTPAASGARASASTSAWWAQVLSSQMRRLSA